MRFLFPSLFFKVPLVVFLYIWYPHRSRPILLLAGISYPQWIRYKRITKHGFSFDNQGKKRGTIEMSAWWVTTVDTLYIRLVAYSGRPSLYISWQIIILLDSWPSDSFVKRVTIKLTPAMDWRARKRHLSLQHVFHKRQFALFSTHLPINSLCSCPCPRKVFLHRYRSLIKVFAICLGGPAFDCTILNNCSFFVLTPVNAFFLSFNFGDAISDICCFSPQFSITTQNKQWSGCQPLNVFSDFLGTTKQTLWLTLTKAHMVMVQPQPMALASGRTKAEAAAEKMYRIPTRDQMTSVYNVQEIMAIYSCLWPRLRHSATAYSLPNCSHTWAFNPVNHLMDPLSIERGKTEH